MTQLLSIGDDEEHAGYAIVRIRIPKDSELFHKILDIYWHNKSVDLEVK